MDKREMRSASSMPNPVNPKASMYAFSTYLDERRERGEVDIVDLTSEERYRSRYETYGGDGKKNSHDEEKCTECVEKRRREEERVRAVWRARRERDSDDDEE